jgi:maltose alpha-D-glucosyltransferase/alpha-amylase
MLLAEIETRMSLDTARYVLPFGLVAEGEAASALPEQLALARVRRGRQVGFLTDAFALRGFVLRMFELTQTGANLSCNNEAVGELRFIPTSRMAGVALADDVEIRYLSVARCSS